MSRAAHEDALNKPSEKPSLLTKHLNVWQNSSTGWLSQLDWMKCVGERSIDDLAGQPAYIGFDLSTRLDITAVVLVTMDGDNPAIFPFMFVPEGAIEGNKNASAYLEWIEAGYLIKTEGNSVDFALVKETILELADKFSIQGIAYDQWQGEQLAQELFNDHGMNVQKFVGVPKYFSPVMRHFEALVADHKLRHPDNPCLNWMAANISVKPNNRGITMPLKPDRQEHLKIDGMVAALMGMAIQLSEQEEQGEVQILFL